MMAKNSSSRLSQFSILFLGVLSISTAAIFIRYAQQEAGSLIIATGRMVFAVILLVPYILIWHRPVLRIISRKDLLLSLLSGIFLAFHFASWITSLEYTTVASSVVLVCTTPIWVTLFSIFVFREKVNWTILIGVLIALFGGILVALNEVCNISFSGIQCNFASASTSTNVNFGNFLALIGALLAAGYLLIGKSVRRTVELAPYVLITYSMAALTLIIVLVVTRTPINNYSPNTYLFILLIALFPQIIGHSALNWALKYLSTTYVAVAQLGEPVGSTIFAIILFKEMPTPIKAMGAIMILAGIFIVTRVTDHNQ